MKYDRSYEHQQFLDWLVTTLGSEQIDVLLISGDVFDQSNPSAASVKMFYSFLNGAMKMDPDLQIIVTAGNHDSASRLESPKPLLESSNIHIIGLVEKIDHETIDFDKLTIPLKDRNQEIKAWCLAVPFLRLGDYPSMPESPNPYADGVTAFYRKAYNSVLSKKFPGQAVLAMGHLHAQKAEVGDQDKDERMIMGGVECISASAFDEGICYVALGHIHKAQRIGGKEHIRYSGSPLPMSFSEIHYKHGVVVFDVIEEKIDNLRVIEVPVSVQLQRVPAVHSLLPEVLAALARLPDAEGDISLAPYLEVRVLLDGPEPALRHKISPALAGKFVRLVKIDPQHRNASASANEKELITHDQLHELKPLDVLRRVYQSKYKNDVPEELLKLFQQAAQEVSQSNGEQ